MNTHKHKYALLLAFIIVFFLGGCSEETPDSTGSNNTSEISDISTGGSFPDDLMSREKDIPRHEDGRAIVTLSSFNISPEIETAVVAFNQNNTEYYVQILTAERGTSATDYWEREMIELSTGKGPDLFTKTLQSDFIAYVEKGIMEDLTPYIERDLTKEDYLECSLYAYAKDNKVYALESSFSISLLAGSKELLGQQEGWTFTEMKEIMEANPQLTVFQNSYNGAEAFFQNYLKYGNPCYTDYQTMRECLAFAIDYNKPLPAGELAIPDETVLVEQISLTNALDWADYEALYEQSLTPIGYVNTQQKGIFHNGFGWSMNSASKQKEGVWAFLKYLLSEEYQREYVQDFSPLKKLLEEQLAYYAQPVTYTYFDEELKETFTHTTGHSLTRTSNATKVTPAYVAEHGTSAILIDCMSTEQLDMIRQLIHNSRTDCFQRDAMAQNIIYEETAYFFRGERSLDDVMHNIENRMELYYAEKQHQPKE